MATGHWGCQGRLGGARRRAAGASEHPAVGCRTQVWGGGGGGVRGRGRVPTGAHAWGGCSRGCRAVFAAARRWWLRCVRGGGGAEEPGRGRPWARVCEPPWARAPARGCLGGGGGVAAGTLAAPRCHGSDGCPPWHRRSPWALHKPWGSCAGVHGRGVRGTPPPTPPASSVRPLVPVSRCHRRHPHRGCRNPPCAHPAERLPGVQGVRANGETEARRDRGPGQRRIQLFWCQLPACNPPLSQHSLRSPCFSFPTRC